MIGTAPADDEIEITILGPGYGEAIIVHMGAGSWIVVDSCRARGAERPATLAYFDEIGVRPEDCVELVIASHFHDDHTRGLADVLAACRQADFSCADAFGSREAAALLHLHDPETGMRPRRGKLLELYECFEIVKRRVEAGGGAPLRWASAERGVPLWQDDLGTVRLTALSPTEHAVAGRTRRFRTTTYQRAIDRTDTGDPFEPMPNDIAVALHLEAGGSSLLLGSDLEAPADRRVGWHAVVDRFAGLPGADIVKIPHHGSANAFSEEMWDALAPDASHGLLTPFRNGRVSLPTDPPIGALCARTEGRLLSTVGPSEVRSPLPMISESISADRGALLPMGRVTARRSISVPAGEPWRIWRSRTSANLCSGG